MEHFLIYIILISTIIISGSAIFLFKTDNPKVLKLLLAFSGSFLIAISFLNLIPEVYENKNINTGIYIIIGFVLQLFLELLTKGVEHGHGHVHDCHETHDHSVHYPKVAPIGLMIGICLHSFLEGMPIIEGFDKQVQHSLTVGIVIHNIPLSFVLMSIFIQSGMSKTKSYLLLLIFALMTPLGSFLSNLISNELLTSMHQSMNTYFSIIMGVVVGIFLHVSTSILFETSEDHQYNIKKFAIVILGILIAVLIPIH